MYYELSDYELQKMNEIKEITNTDYEIKGNFIPAENLFLALEDMLLEMDALKEKYEDFKQEVEDNYKPLTNEELYD